MPEALTLREGKDGDIEIQEARTLLVTSAEEALDVVRQASSRLAFAATAMTSTPRARRHDHHRLKQRVDHPAPSMPPPTPVTPAGFTRRSWPVATGLGRRDRRSRGECVV